MKRNDIEPNDDNIFLSLKNDSIGRNNDILNFIQCLEMVDPPYSIFVDSPWGSGKTFFVKEICSLLMSANKQISYEEGLANSFFEGNEKEHASSFLPIYFNAWQFNHYDDPLPPMLACLCERLEESASEEIDCRELIAGAIDCAASVFGLKTDGLTEAFSGKSFLKHFENRQQLRSKIDEIVEKACLEVANTVVLFIDELDRCRPEFAIRLLEQVKTLFQQDQVIVVYSTDRIQLSYSLEGVYGPNFDSLKYLERFYDWAYALSPIDSLEYLKRIERELKCSSSIFVSVALQYISKQRNTMRDCNRLMDMLRRGKLYARRYGNAVERNVPWFCYHALLPVLIIISQKDPLLWADLRKGVGFEEAFQVAADGEKFVECLDSVIGITASYVDADNKLPTKKGRLSFFEDVRAYIFLDDTADQRLKHANERLSIWGNIDKNVFRTLTFPENEELG